MRCIPEQKNEKAVRAIILALLIGGAVLYGIPIGAQAAGIRVYAWLFTALAFVCFIGAVFLLVRYLMTGFQYVIMSTLDEPDDTDLAFAYADGVRMRVLDLPPERLDFIVARSQGRRPSVKECDLRLNQLVAVYPLKRDKKSGGMTKEALRARYAADGYTFYDYTLTFGLEESLGLVFIDGYRYIGVIIEPDEQMRAYFMALKPGSGSRGAEE